MQVKARYASMVGLLAILVLSGLSWLALCESRGQQSAANASQAVDDDESRFPGGFVGNTDCLTCHRGQIREQNFVRLIEPRVWESDPHSQAFKFIDWSGSTEKPSQKLSKEICDKLQINDIRQAQQCLSCHANWITGMTKPPPFFEDGVGCESCHGPSLNWVFAHRQPDWRALPVQAKEAKKMIDVRNPVRRAEQCFSCHIGNLAEGKVLTHAMYAAGHPPLPSIEIESFAEQMPRHWRYLEEKIMDTRQATGDEKGGAVPFELFHEFVAQNHTYLKSDRPEETLKLVEQHNHGAAAVVLGGVVALRESVELIQGFAASERVWPELATFDCTACHHDLKQAPGTSGNKAHLRAGRPTMHAWSAALVPLAISHISSDVKDYDDKLTEFKDKLAALQSEFETTPFGDPDRLEKACDEFSQWLTESLIVPVAARSFDDKAVRRATSRLILIGSREDQDYDSARQIAWALRTLYCDLDSKPPRHAEIQAVFRQLASDLRLDFPNGSDDFCVVPKLPAPVATPALPTPPVALADSVPLALATEVHFSAERFRETMNQLLSLLK